MSPFDLATLTERTLAVRRHLDRVAAKLPGTPAELVAGTDTSDAVILHLWQAVQIVIDVAVSASVALGAGTPATYADAFARLARTGVIDGDLASRLSRAAGFRNLVAHAYESIDMARVFEAATNGPADLRAFLRAIGERLGAAD